MKKAAILSALCLLLTSVVCAQSANPRVHYYYNSGWLVETDRHVLVFDFVTHPESGTTTTALSRDLQQAAAGNKKIVVFISHDHNDHFDSSVFRLNVPGQEITYILGWRPKVNPGLSSLHVLAPGDSLIRADYRVFTHAATDDGSGFLVLLDGQAIYHAGDHALWAEALLPDFQNALLYVKSKAPVIDLAFLPAARGMFVHCKTDSTLEKGLQVSALILRPKTIALQHIGCADQLPLYSQTADWLAALRTKWMIPRKYNQSF
jgi:L-ascorbate metabolism protein UlaG (beta-lactamase superfamily)